MTSFRLNEITANVFHTPYNYSLAHCVSADFQSEKGSLAWQFGVIFGQVDALSRQQVHTGNVAILEDQKRIIYYLVTRETMHDCSDYMTIEAALICMREHMRKHSIHKVALPRLGSGSDRLEWPRVKQIICNVFAHEYNVEMLVCDNDTPPMKIPTTCQIIEIKGNLFAPPTEAAMVHLVSGDIAACRGVSLHFKCKLGGGGSGGGTSTHADAVPPGKQQHHHKHNSNVAVQRDGDHYVYNLITKERSHERCTYPALYYALCAMREHMIQHDVTKLAIPRLSIDSLDWLHVRQVLELVFGNDSVTIYLYVRSASVLHKHSTMSVHSAAGMEPVARWK